MTTGEKLELQKAIDAKNAKHWRAFVSPTMKLMSYTVTIILSEDQKQALELLTRRVNRVMGSRITDYGMLHCILSAGSGHLVDERVDALNELMDIAEASAAAARLEARLDAGETEG